MTAADGSNVRAQLSRILSSSAFVNSPRMSRFLKFVVETTLAGDGPRIKEYVIAVEVFDKAEDYDPQADSTVRTEAGKLRAKLARYYGTEGREDSLIIAIPKGTYVPTFGDRRNGAVEASRAGFPMFAGLIGAALIAVVVLAFLSRSSPRPKPTLVQVTSYPGLEQQPSLSPDGSRVAFRWKNDIYVKQIGSEAFVQVTKDPAVDSWPAWSPDGSQIAFVREGDVFLVSPFGGGERRVAKSIGRVAWMPDGLSLLTLEKTSPHAGSVFRVSVAAGEKRRLTFPSDLNLGDVDMAASPDGRTIAVCRTVTTEGCDLYLVPASGGDARRLTKIQRGIQGFAWTSDGKQIVFASNQQGWFQLWRVGAHPGASGTYQAAVLVEGAGDDARNPSIQGARVVYQRHTRNFDIRRAEIAGVPGTAAHGIKSSTPLITSTRLDATPSWSPDGRKIAFVSDRSGARELWICDADGSSPIKLTAFSGAAVIYPRWSPDGQRLVFSALTGTDGNFEGFTMDAKGGRPEHLSVRGHPSIAHPIFSTDGRWLYFIPGPGERAVEAWRVPASGGDAIQITQHGAFRPEVSADGKLLFYGKHGTHGLWSWPIEGGQERQVLDSITEMNWTVVPQGIYYIDFGIEPNAPKSLMFWSSRTGKANRVGLVEPTVSGDYSGMSVSPDGRWLLYSYIADLSSDLMMVEHFR
jgi:Tol biopolymer transport system component